MRYVRQAAGEGAIVADVVEFMASRTRERLGLAFLAPDDDLEIARRVMRAPYRHAMTEPAPSEAEQATLDRRRANERARKRSAVAREWRRLAADRAIIEARAQELVAAKAKRDNALRFTELTRLREELRIARLHAAYKRLIVAKLTETLPSAYVSVPPREG